MEPIQRVVGFFAGLSLKAVFALAALFGIVAETAFTNHQWGNAALAGVIASIFTASLTVLPRIMEQRRKGRESAASLTANLIKEMTAFHSEKEKFWQHRIAEKELIVTLERNCKNNAVTEWNCANTQVKILEAMLRGLNVEPPSYREKSYDEIVGETDRKIEKVVQNRVTETPPSYGG